jgi:hypothetical protein
VFPEAAELQNQPSKQREADEKKQPDIQLVAFFGVGHGLPITEKPEDTKP